MVLPTIGGGSPIGHDVCDESHAGDEGDADGNAGDESDADGNEGDEGDEEPQCERCNTLENVICGGDEDYFVNLCRDCYVHRYGGNGGDAGDEGYEGDEGDDGDESNEGRPEELYRGVPLDCFQNCFRNCF
jgi:hypothetical protein